MTAHTPDKRLSAGERVSLRRRLSDDTLGDLVGFVLTADTAAVTLLDRRGVEHRVARADVVAARIVGVARGRDPRRAPRDLLDALAAEAGVSGRVFVARISDLLAGRRPPATVPSERGCIAVEGGVARCQGEWVTAPAGADLIEVAWWATRQDARSMQVRTDDTGALPRLSSAGFTELP